MNTHAIPEWFNPLPAQDPEYHHEAVEEVGEVPPEKKKSSRSVYHTNVVTKIVKIPSVMSKYRKNCKTVLSLVRPGLVYPGLSSMSITMSATSSATLSTFMSITMSVTSSAVCPFSINCYNYDSVVYQICNLLVKSLPGYRIWIEVFLSVIFSEQLAEKYGDMSGQNHIEILLDARLNVFDGSAPACPRWRRCR